MSDAQTELEEIRRQIDALDERIVSLINERARLVIRIGQSKSQGGLSVYAPDRERAVLDRVRQLNQGPMDNRTIAAVYHELMSGSLVLERPPRIAILGPKGSFSHLAATRKFGSSVEFDALEGVEAIFDEVERNRVDLGVVPVENSIGGGVIDSLDAFLRHNVSVCAEINLAVHHHLLGRCPLSSVQKVYSKPQAFTQCRRWLTETGLMDKTVATASTSKAAELAASEENAAAIGSTLAGELYGLTTLRDRIEDDSDNVTRFLVISQNSAKPTGRDKTSIVFAAANKPGALVEVLEVWRKAGVNMTFIESRPSRREKWDYSFFVDLEGHAEDPAVGQSIDKVRELCSFLKVVGSYPRADEVLQ